MRGSLLGYCPFADALVKAGMTVGSDALECLTLQDQCSKVIAYMFTVRTRGTFYGHFPPHYRAKEYNRRENNTQFHVKHIKE